MLLKIEWQQNTTKLINKYNLKLQQLIKNVNSLKRDSRFSAGNIGRILKKKHIY